ncbi:MAG: FitA-like ribbon-helix-helix domain-containing protein [Thermoanaerobaculia bacterium]
MVQIDEVTERLLRARAHQDGVTMEEEARKLLDRALRSDWDSFWERVDRVQQSLTGQSFPDSAELIREDRA